MDPLAALGLAGNVIALVDFLWTVLSEAREIYKSPSGESEENRFIDVLIGDIEAQSHPLLDLPGSTSELNALVRESRDIANQVIAGASTVKRKSRSRWRSFSAALKDVWGRDKTQVLLSRLGRLQSHISIHLLRTIT